MSPGKTVFALIAAVSLVFLTVAGIVISLWLMKVDDEMRRE